MTPVAATAIALVINYLRRENIDVQLISAVALKSFNEKCGSLFEETTILHNQSFKRSSCVWVLLGAGLG